MKKGVTLVELLIAISIFSIAIVSFMGLFTWAINYYRENILENYLLDSASYMLDYLTRALRMAQKDIQGNCIGQNLNYYQSNPNRIKFLNSKGECIEFYLDSNQLMILKSNIPLTINPPNLLVEDLKFKILGESQDDNLQPRVTIVLKLRNNTQPQKTFIVQTTISQRQLDVQY